MSAFVIAIICVVVGGVGNGLILWIYSRNKQLPVRTFILILAVLDFYSSVVLMPHMLASYMGVLHQYVTVPQGLFLAISYDYVTVTMALDRVIATFRPFQYAKYRRTLLKVMASLMIAVIVVMESFVGYLFVNEFITELPASAFVGRFSNTVYVSQNILSLITVAVAYPAIGFKLHRQAQNISPKIFVVNENPTVMMSMTKQKKESALHIKTLKLYVAILGLFLVYFMSNLLWIVAHRLFGFLRVINFCGNFFVYYIMIDPFRDEVNACGLKFKRSLCCLI